MATMKEQSQKIRSAGMEEPERENARKPKENSAGPEGKQKQSGDLNPSGTNEEKPNGLESSEPPQADKQGPPTEEITEPPAPTEKTPEEMSKPPEAFMDPEDAERIGGNPEVSEEFAGERDANAEAENVDKQMVDEMGAEKGLTDHLTEAFRDFLEPGQKKQKTMREQSDAIRNAGNEEEGPEEEEHEHEEAGGARRPTRSAG